ncbi:MAG TPA: TolC family protein [Mucilaginibacter sp.]|nr:TolC family protein [Mucilaginibacter sp.]
MSSRTHLVALIFTGTAFFTALNAKAQDTTKNLSLNEAIAATLSNNRALQIAKLDEGIAIANYKQTQAVFLPRVDLSYTAIRTNDPLNAFGFKLEQQSITPNDFDPSLLNHPGGTTDIITKLEVQQPILNLDMLYARKGAGIQTEVYRYKTQRTKEYLTFEVQKAWLQLQLAYDAEDVLDDAQKTARAVYKFTDDHYRQGLIQRSDVLNAQVHLAGVESNLAKAKSNIRNASDYLSLLMGTETGVVYKISGQTMVYESTIDTVQKVSDSRADLMALKKAIEASDMMVKSNQLSYLPKLNAFGNYQYNDANLTGFGANSYLAGIQLSWDIFKGNTRKNKITEQRLERDKIAQQLAQQKEQSNLEISKAYRDLSDARFEITREKSAVAQAAESLRILRNRYEQGLINTTDILAAETQLSQQKFALAQAVYGMNVTRAYLALLTTSTIK